MEPIDKERKALTLVELLVVVTIMVLLLGVVLPLAGPALRGREVREAARQVSAFLLSAQADAIASGRPIGVVLTPDPNDFSRCYVLEKVKIPPPLSPPNVTVKFAQDNLPDDRVLMFSPSPTALRVIRPQSTFQIQFQYRGRYYTGRRDSRGTPDLSDDYFLVRRDEFPDLNQNSTRGDDDDVPRGTRSNDTGVRFRIHLPPRRSSASRLELPTGAYVDLIASGVAGTPSPINNATAADFEGVLYHDVGYLPDSNGMPPAPLEPARLLFDSQGKLDKFWGEIVFPARVVDNPVIDNNVRVIGPRVVGPWQPWNPIHLLVTNVKRTMPQPPQNPPTLQRAQLKQELSKSLVATNGGMWVTILPSGKVTTTENVGIPVDPGAPGLFKAAVYTARSKIRYSPQAGGQ